MWVHRWNPITCRLDLVELSSRAASMLKPLGAVALVGCIAHGDVVVPPVEAHSPPPVPVVEVRHAPGSTNYPGYPPAWGYAPSAGIGGVRTPWLDLPTPPVFVPAHVYHHTKFEVDCDDIPAAPPEGGGVKQVPEPSIGVWLLGAALGLLVIGRLVWRDAP